MCEKAWLEKVAALITRQGRAGPELLLFQHPNAGIQIPGGTIEEDENTDAALLREVHEETGLQNVRIVRYIGRLEVEAPEGTRYVLHRTKVYARPDRSSFDWTEFRRGIPVQVLRRAGGFTQAIYEEWDRYPDPSYVTYSITGWVPDEALCRRMRRHFFHLRLVPESDKGNAPDTWSVFTDNSTFQLFWAPLDCLPPIVEPQSGWLHYVRSELGYELD